MKESMEFLLLEDIILSATKNSMAYYMPNSGNWGDALIRTGTRRFLSKIGLNCREIKKLKDLSLLRKKGGTLLYGGGGGWCNTWNHSHNIVEKALKKFDNIIVLPSSFENSYNIDNTIFFSRDKFESLSNMTQAHFCHDMAFYIGSIDCEAGDGDGYFFRTDNESAGKFKIPDTNLDISSMGKTNTGVFEFIETVSKFKRIYTDRLHVAIISVLLGKELHLYEGNYFKNRAVFNSSIKNNFDSVHYHNDFDL